MKSVIISGIDIVNSREYEYEKKKFTSVYTGKKKKN